MPAAPTSDRSTSYTAVLSAATLALVAGTMVSGGCAKRTGWWNRDKNPTPNPEPVLVVTTPETTPSAFTTATESKATFGSNESRTGSFYASTPTGTSRSGLASNGSASIDSTDNGWTQTEPTEFQSEPVSTVASADNGESWGGIPASSFEPVPSTPVGSTGGTLETSEYEPAEPTPVATGTPNRSEDLSAIIYGNAMGAELPVENAREATSRATLNVRQITASYAGADFDPTPTPDGEYLVFASTQHRPTADIYMKSVNGSVVTRLTDDPAQDVMPSVSPDGSFIAFASDRNGSWDIFVMPSEGGKAVQLTGDNTHDLHPTWSPDGSKLAFCRLGQQTGRWEMWVADVASVNNAQFVGFGLFPQWCPASGTGFNGADKILFQRSRERGDRAFSVWTIDYNSNPGTAGRETEIATAPDSALINPSWSPDGSFVAFAQVPYSEAWASGSSPSPDSSTLWMISIEGTGKVKLTDGHSVDLMPAWSKSNEIFFVSNMGGQDHLWSMELSPAIRAASVQIPSLDRTFVTAPTGSSTGE